MKIAVLTARHNTLHGGAEIFYDGLEAALRSAAESVDRIDVPADESSFERILESYRNVSGLDLSAYDVVISTKTPTYNIEHPAHILYLVHTTRVFYDMFDWWTDGSELSKRQRDQIREMDFRAISRIPEERRFAIGQEVAQRLQKFLGLSARVLHPPLSDADQFQSGKPEHFFHPGRLHPWKRLDLVLNAFESLDEQIELLISGIGEADPSFKDRVSSNPRIRFLGDVSRSELYDLYARSLAVPFVPVREDYGYVAVEAMMSGVPVITTKDSGEPSRIVQHEKTGLVVNPTVEDIAGAMKRFLHSPEEAKQMGMAGRKVVERNNWPDVVRKLITSLQDQLRLPGTDPNEHPVRKSTSVYRLLILDNQPIEPPVGGARIRLWGLYSNLPKRLMPVYVGTYDWPGEEYRSFMHNDTLLEITVPQSPAHFAAHEAWRKTDPSLTMDVTFPVLSFLSAGYVERVSFEMSQSDAIVLSHPWVWPIVAQMKEAERKPLFYDAHNVESLLRRHLLAPHGIGRTIADLIERLEREVCNRADGIFACSEEDAGSFVRLYGVSRSRIHIIPNGVNTKQIRPALAVEKRNARRVLGLSDKATVAIFIGTRYKPNIDAAQLICDRLAPASGRIVFLIVGGCTADLEGDIPKNVHALGLVEDAIRNQAYQAADFAINPILHGSGTNIKMIDFLAAGLPTITTPTGMRGFHEVDESFLVARSDDFESAIERLMTEPGLREQLARRARLAAEMFFDWKPISANLATAILQTLRKSTNIKKGSVEPRLAVMSTWKTRCGIADYSNFLVHSLPSSVQWSIYAESGSCGEPNHERLSANWQIGLPDFVPLSTSLAQDRIQLLLIQHNPAFFREIQLMQLLRLAREKDVKTAVTFHALRSLSLSPSLHEELSRADRLFVHRQSDIEWLRVCGVSDTVRLLPHGITRFRRRSVAAVQKELGLDGAFVIGHFGYVRPYKGTLDLIEGFELLANEQPNARLLLLCSEYPYLDSEAYLRLCLDRIASSKYRDRIHLNFKHLPMRTVIHLLQACNLIVYPYHSSNESSSAAVRFAISASRPILVSKSPIFEELEQTPVVLENTTASEIANGILSLIDDSAALIDCQKRVEKFGAAHDWARVSAMLWGHMKSLLENGS